MDNLFIYGQISVLILFISSYDSIVFSPPKGTKPLTDVYQSMALHMFLMLNSLTVHVKWSVPSNIFRGNVTWNPASNFQLSPKDFYLVSLGMNFFSSHPRLCTSYSKSIYTADVPSSCLVQSKCHADFTSCQIPIPVRSLCYRTRLHTLGSVFSHSNMPLGADCRRCHCHAVQTSVCAHVRCYWLHRAPLCSHS